MKKILFLGFIVSSALASCKKDYTCTCTLTPTNGSPATTRIRTLNDIRKDDAKRVCVDYQEIKNGVTTNASCSLK